MNLQIKKVPKPLFIMGFGTFLIHMETVGVEPTSRDIDYLSVYERSQHIWCSLILMPADGRLES